MIYLDNAATSFPKPRSVLSKTLSAVNAPLGNPGRSGHLLSKAAGEAVFSARERLADLIGLSSPERIVFCSGATAALNFAIFGTVSFLGRNKIPLVYTDVLEHNSVLRPLFHLEKEGKIRLYIAEPERDGNLSSHHLLALSPDVLVLTCRSNVTGHVFHLRNTIEELKKRGCVVIMDAAQALGSATVTFQSTGADILCAPGHKGLLGIMGAGFLAVSETCPLLPDPILFGGSGTDSFLEEMPSLLPERLEAGTLPLPAIVSMAAGAEFLLKEGVEAIGERERGLKKILVEGLFMLPAYEIFEPEYADGPLLIRHRTRSAAQVESELSAKGIMVRGGFHCAPLAHRFLGTEKSGGVRLSPGPFTRKEEIYQTLQTLAHL